MSLSVAALAIGILETCDPTVVPSSRTFLPTFCDAFEYPL